MSSPALPTRPRGSPLTPATAVVNAARRLSYKGSEPGAGSAAGGSSFSPPAPSSSGTPGLKPQPAAAGEEELAEAEKRLASERERVKQLRERVADTRIAEM